MQHGEVGGVADLVDERGRAAAGRAAAAAPGGCSRCRPRRRRPEPVAVLVGEVDDEALVDHRVQQVVGRGPRQAARLGDPLERHRRRLARPGTAAPAACGSRPARCSWSPAVRRCLGSETDLVARASRRCRRAGVESRHDAHRRSRRTTVTVGTGPVSLDDVVAVARDGAGVAADATRRSRAVEAGRAVVEELAAAPTPAYGISTGFGALATRHIPPEKRAQLQRSLVRSHAAGSGPEVEREVTRALMLLRLSTLATGRTGIRPETAQLLAGLLSHGITPVVHEYGSLGCSGDLAPLAHCALALMGEGPVRRADGSLADAATALAEAGLTPVELAAKEGLALINGTDGMLGMLVLALHDLAQPAARSPTSPPRCRVEAQLGTDRVFAEDLQALRPHPGPGRLGGQPAPDARRLRRRGQPPRPGLQPGPGRLLAALLAAGARCGPRHLGARRHGRRPRAGQRRRQPGRAADGRVESNGNFHGAPVGYVLDFLAIAVADVASISERRTDRFLDRARNHGLPPFLADDPGVDSGHMIAQYTQAAHRLGAQAARRARRASTRSRARRCRRTTSRWAGRRHASCAAPSTG